MSVRMRRAFCFKVLMSVFGMMSVFCVGEKLCGRQDRVKPGNLGSDGADSYLLSMATECSTLLWTAHNKAKIAQPCYSTAYHKIRLKASRYGEKLAAECMQVMLRFLMR